MNKIFSFLIVVISFFILLPANIYGQIEQQRNVEIDGDPNPEFIIHWRNTDFSSNERANEVVALVETAARISWNTIITQWNFVEPPDDDGGVDIYIWDNANPWGPAQVIMSPGDGSFRWKLGTDQYIYVHHNRQQTFSNIYNVEWPTEQDSFTDGISHEFFHCVQDGYNVLSRRAWIYEGTARFVPSALNPNGSFYTPQSSNRRSLYIRDAVEYLTAPEDTLSGKSYNACIFWRYIFENLGGINTIINIFNQINTDSPTSFENELNAINTVLQPSTTIRETFINFGSANYLEFSSNPFARDDDFYEYSSSYYENVALVYNRTYEYTGNELTINSGSDTQAGSYGTNYIEFISKQKENIDVQVEFQGNGDTNFLKRIILYNDADYPQGEVFGFVDDVIIISEPNKYDKIAIVIANTGTTGNGDYSNTVRHGYCDMKLDKVTRHNKADKG